MIEKILNEISRLKKELKGYSASEALDYIEAYINTLPKEPVSEDLEIEIENYINRNFSEGCDGGMLSDSEPNLGGVTYCDLANLARHFAEWGITHK